MLNPPGLSGEPVVSHPATHRFGMAEAMSWQK